MSVFVAGATGAIGEPLIAELMKQGHSVAGMTKGESGAQERESQGAEAVIVDALDAAASEAAVRQAKPKVVIGELTSLPKEQSDMPKYAAGERKLRIEGGGNLPGLFLLLEAGTSTIDFLIPALPAGKIGRLAVYTSRTAPDDLFEPEKGPLMQGQNGFRPEPRSSAILLSDGGEVLRDN